MKIITILGVRPQIIRLNVIIKKLDQLLGQNHVLVNTGQNFDPKLNDIFIYELGVRNPNYHLGIRASNQFEQIGKMMMGLNEVFEKENPDAIFILGDTNTDLAAAVTARHFRKNNQKGIQIFHMEAGNRAFDQRVPEETNRKIVDHISTINMVYTHRSKEHLYHEGLRNTFVVGNPMKEVMMYHQLRIENSRILDSLKIEKSKYMLITLHRSENVDCADNLALIISALEEIFAKYKLPIIFSTHPRAKDKMMAHKIEVQNKNSDIRFIEPVGFLDFVKLQKEAKLVASDSGTVPEESTILGVPNIILRETTERTELLDHGCSILAGASNKARIIKAFDITFNKSIDWSIPAEYQVSDVSNRVINIILSHISNYYGGI